MNRVYLDYASTTPISKLVKEAMLPYYSSSFSNPSAMHKSGRNAAAAIKQARIQIANLLQVKPEEIIFTGSGTESDNLAILGAARAYKDYGKHIITSAIEHKAVLESIHALEEEGFTITILPVDKFGRVKATDVLKAVRSDTILISIMLGNNEIGTIQPIKEIADLLSEYIVNQQLPLLHTDACQAAGYLPINPEELGVDMLTLNGSKIYGPKGIGLLYKKQNLQLKPIIFGGGQENGYRGGTESVPNIIGLATALTEAEREREAETERLWQQRVYLKQGLEKLIPELIVNGHPDQTLPHILHITVPKIEGESMLLMLDDLGIEVATGSACSAQDLRPSYVLQAIGQDDDLIHGSIRFSLGRQTTKEDLNRVMSRLPPIVSTLQRTSVLTTQYYAQTK